MISSQNEKASLGALLHSSVGETAVAQKYLKERNVEPYNLDPYKDITMAPAAPLDPSHFQPDPLALIPTGDLPTVFAVGELVFRERQMSTCGSSNTHIKELSRNSTQYNTTMVLLRV